jgi:hypothetical protein
LVYSLADDKYSGKLSLAGMTQGPLQLVVLAKDVAGDTLSATRTFIYDRAPILIVESPLPYSSSQGKVHIKATVTDPGHTNCAGLLRTDDNPYLPSFSLPFVNSIDTLIDIYPGINAASYQLYIVATDSLNFRTSVLLPLFSDKSSYLTPVNIDSGLIIDADSTRILRRLTHPDSLPKFKIFNTITNTSTLIYTDSTHDYTIYNNYSDSRPVGGLCKGGAWFVLNYNGARINHLYLWQGDSLRNISLPLGTDCLTYEIQAAGNTLMWATGILTTGGNRIGVTDLTTLTTFFIDNAVNGALSTDGKQLAYAIPDYSGPVSTESRIYKYDVSSQIATQITFSGNPFYPSIDGSNIVYQKRNGPTNLTYLHDGTTEQLLGAVHNIDKSYRLYNGYVAFQQQDSGDVEQVWLRSPAGALKRISTFPRVSRVDVLGAGGRMLFQNFKGGGSTNFVRHYSDSVTDNIAVSGPFGNAYFLNNNFYLDLGGTLYSYFIPPPVLQPQITAVTPDSGITGSLVTIKGLHLANTSVVKFGGTNATSFTNVSDSVVTAIIDTGTTGDVTLTTPGGTTTFSDFHFIFQLPADLFDIINTGTTCRGTNDGSISISASPETMNYITTITRPVGFDTTFNFNTGVVLHHLAAGTYNICLSLTGHPEYQQCFTSVITQPEDLSAYIAVNRDDRQVTLSLTGAASYHIKLNETEITTAKSQLTLDLKKGLNKIAVSTDKPCQGTILKNITIGTELIVYPNPFQETINLNLGKDNIKKAIITIYNAGGKIVYSRSYSNQSGPVSIDLPDMSNGLYMLKLIADNEETIFKLLKK